MWHSPYWRFWGIVFLSILSGCASKSQLFRTPYDKDLRRALRKQKEGWVTAGPSANIASAPTTPVLMPGQFLRMVLETPRPIIEEGSFWQVVHVDTLRILEDSLVYIPWVGSVRVGGVALDSAQRLLEGAARRIFTGARVRIYPLYPYYVFGYTAVSGRVLLEKSKISLVELFSVLAANPSFSALDVDFSRVKVIRGNLSNPQVFLIDMRDASVMEGGFYLYAGDILVMEPRQVVKFRLELQNYVVLIGMVQILDLLLLISPRLGL